MRHIIADVFGTSFVHGSEFEAEEALLLEDDNDTEARVDATDSCLLRSIGSLSSRLPPKSVIFLDSCENCAKNSTCSAIFAKVLYKLLLSPVEARILVASCYRLNVHPNKYKETELKELSLEAAVTLMQQEVSEPPPAQHLEKIARYFHCNPLGLQMAIAALEGSCDNGLSLLSDLDSSPCKSNKQATDQLQLLLDLVDLGGAESLTERMKRSFQCLESANRSAFTALLHLSLLPGPFTVQEINAIGLGVSGQQQTHAAAVFPTLKRHRLLDKTHKQDRVFYQFPSLIRDFAERTRLETEVDRESKIRFLHHYCLVLKEMSTRFWTDTAGILKDMDAQILNFRCLLTGVVKWENDYIGNPQLLGDIYHGFVARNVSYILSMRFPIENRLAVFETLREIVTKYTIPDVNPTTGEADVLVEMAIIRSRRGVEYRQQALEHIQEASELYAGEAAHDQHKAIFEFVEATIHSKMKRRPTSSKSVEVEAMLDTSVSRFDQLRLRSSDRDQKLFWTDHLAAALKELAFVYEMKHRKKTESLELLQKSLQLRIDIYGRNHICLAYLLWTIAVRQTSLFLESKYLERKELLESAVEHLNWSLSICQYYGRDDQDICGRIYLARAHAKTVLRQWDAPTQQDFMKAKRIFTELKNNYRLANVYSQWAYLWRCRGERLKEIRYLHECLTLRKTIKPNRKPVLEIVKSIGNAYTSLERSKDADDINRAAERLEGSFRWPVDEFLAQIIEYVLAITGKTPDFDLSMSEG